MGCRLRAHRLGRGHEVPSDFEHVPGAAYDSHASRREHEPVKWVRGGLVLKAGRSLYRSTLGSRVIDQKRKIDPNVYRSPTGAH